MRLLIITLLFVTIHAEAKPFHVIVDPGHGGSDSGAMHSQFREADITLSVSKYLNTLLKKSPGIKITMTRSRNKTISLYSRSELANRLKGDLFLSIHVNSNPNPKARGAEFYFESQLPPDEEALYLASRENHFKEVLPREEKKKTDIVAIIDDLKRTFDRTLSLHFTRILRNTWGQKFKLRRKVIRQAPFHVLSEVDMPSILIELGFISNPREARSLARASTQREMARLIHRSVLEYKESMDINANSIHITQNAKR